VLEMTGLFLGETGEFCPHSAACTPTHPQIALKLRIAEIILQAPYIVSELRVDHDDTSQRYDTLEEFLADDRR
jgi:hypothetical protein